MPALARRPSDREAFGAVLRQCFPLFLAKVFDTVSPGSEYLHNWHIDAIAEYLRAVELGQVRRLIVNMPPRNLKSIAITVAWSAWLLGHDPSRQVMAASYASTLSMKHNVDTRLVCSSWWFREAFPRFRFAPDQNEKQKFQTSLRGHRIATSVGASAIGEGGDFLICDDPHNPLSAISDKERKTACDWFDQSFTTRLNNKKKGAIVVVMQRLHETDLSGHLLAKGGWEHLKLAAQAPKRTVISIGNFHKVREEGDILHPEREGPKELAAAKVDLGSYGYAGQYDQEPAPREGGVLKLAWFRRYRAAPDPAAGAVRYVQSWDTAQKEGEMNDYSVCTEWAIEGPAAYLLRVHRDKVDSVDLLRNARALYRTRRPSAVLIEDKGSGTGLIQALRRDAELSIPVVPIDPRQDKIVRADNVAPLIEAGHIHIPEDADWLHDFEAEVRNFPNAAHDDQVDSVTQFVEWFARGQYAGAAASTGKRESAREVAAEKTDTGWGTVRLGNRYRGF